ncbi:GNAT family N-acetyltransferase [Streptomyces yunnanensis]|uniref:GNAT family N-acetyltransferase n=1 Tax=Streptomyces yunnanensis TaxID=156453 RepID=A0ABY8AJV3_9ACTN|nr:GNAT family N-acetyltransferase [Streptomyces yunnanensis]WEB44481.1 GNAT family N-acetyltransferase [Streptomyces yunnanensis]
MPPEAPVAPSADNWHAGYTLSLTRHEYEVRAAQRLRHLVFVREMGGRERTGAGVPLAGHDIDDLDDHCDHLLVHETVTGAVVATCRLLPPRGAAAAGRLDSDAYFDLSRHRRLHGDLVEISRACIHPAHRGGTLVPLLTLGVARYVLQSGHAWVGGNAVVPMGNHGELPSVVWRWVAPQHLAPEDYRVDPLIPVPTDVAAAPGAGMVPPLVLGALSLGAWVCGAPGYHLPLGTAALYLLMPMRHVDPALLRDLPDLSAR